MIIQHDNNGQPFVEWQQMAPGGPGTGGFKRAWIRRPTSADRDWAGTGRYVNVAMIGGLGQGPSGPSADFPIFNQLPDDQVLVAFVAAVCGLTGCEIP
jgi:hypothetical protein